MRLHTTQRTSARELCREIRRSEARCSKHCRLSEWRYWCPSGRPTSGMEANFSASDNPNVAVRMPDKSIYLAGQGCLVHRTRPTRRDVGSYQCRADPLRSNTTGAQYLYSPGVSSAGFSRSIGLSGLPVSPDNTESLSVIGMGSYPLGNWSPERPGKHAIIGVRPMPRSEPRHGRRIFNRVSSDRRNEHSGGGHKKMNRTRFSAIRAAARRHEALIPCRVGTQ
jgi:hypothetical protein